MKVLIKRIWLRQCEDYAFNAGIIETQHLQKISKLFRRPKVEHRPALSPSELPVFFKDVQATPKTTFLVLSLLKVAFYTLLRPGEYTVMKWDWIRNDIIEVPADSMKMKRPHRVPVSSLLKAVLKRIGYKDKLTAHGIRSIGRTWMAENKIPFDVAELCLAHSVGTQTVQAYNRTDLLDERRDAMQAWCDFVEQCQK